MSAGLRGRADGGRGLTGEDFRGDRAAAGGGPAGGGSGGGTGI
jgi:hypothetical protein